ncbi:F-box domain [Lasallia pustulata]|uniref:F-box domain n=1 Tax=Lasallia pustulata TaxID=136370 RepID=A0A1W5CYV4_9LECA|nr:F-box domain [Lasallia pustulata]
MPSGIVLLPLELLLNVVSYLNFEDFVNLSNAQRELASLLGGESTCHKVVKKHILHTKEAVLALQQQSNYRTAIRRVFGRREAFAKALPYSASVLGYGSTFIYQDGFLCYSTLDTIRVLDIHGQGESEHVIHVPSLINYLGIPCGPYSLELLQYQCGTLALLSSSDGTSGEAWLFAVDVGVSTPSTERVKLLVSVAASSKTFVRQDSHYLCYGTHTGIGSHGHHEWEVLCYKLNSRGVHAEIGHKPLQLKDLAGSDLGVTVAFRVRKGYLYALSNQTTFDIEEVDWTSYYHCYRFPLNDPRIENLEKMRIWRRQHREGPINDSWTDLALHVDECTGNLLIVESRREWQNGQSTQWRTYYTQPLAFSTCQNPDAPSSSFATAASNEPVLAQSLPFDDPLVRTLGEDSKPNWEPGHKRLPKYYHPEYSGDPNLAPPRFLLPKTKYRTYDPNCSAFLDLVVDEQALLPYGRHPHLRLRIGSRQLRSPLDPGDKSSPNGVLRQPDKDQDTDVPIDGTEDRFIDRGVCMWPPLDAPADLLDVINPGHQQSSNSYIGEVHAVADERSIVYKIGSSGIEKPITLINFDPGIRLRGLRKLDPPLTHGRAETETVDEGMREVALETLREKRAKEKARAYAEEPDERVFASVEWTGDSWFREEKAMYIVINKGFQIRRS